VLTVASAKRCCRLGRTIVSRCSTHFQTTQWVPMRSGRLPYLYLWTIPLLALVWEDGIWSDHVLQWSFAWPLPWLLSYCRFPCPNILDICTRRWDSLVEEFLRWLSIVALALALYAFYHDLLPTNTFSPHEFALHPRQWIPYYCTSICVRSWCNCRASCVDSRPKKKFL